MHRVVGLAFERVEGFDLSSIAEVFTSSPLADRYSFGLAAAGAGSIATTHGYRIGRLEPLTVAAEQADTVVVPGFAGRPHRGGLAAIRSAHRRGARIVSVCTGAFALAEAGVLDGRPATTHWLRTSELATRYPAIDVRHDVLFVDDGDVLTSAGTAAGLDLCLHVVRRDHGAAVANEVARRLVVAPHRDGRQAQHVERPVASTSGRLHGTRTWAIETLGADLDVPAMARHANLSPRHFTRLFVAETGATPHRWLTVQRLVHAQRLLETTGLSIEEVATESGFKTAAALRERFRCELHTSPTAYRRGFSERNRPGAPV